MKPLRTDVPTTRLVPQKDWSTAGVARRARKFRCPSEAWVGGCVARQDRRFDSEASL
jgi:hypothetical protein